MKQSITRLGIAAALLVSVFAARAPDPSPVAASTAPPASPSETLTLVRLQAAQAAALSGLDLRRIEADITQSDGASRDSQTGIATLRAQVVVTPGGEVTLEGPIRYAIRADEPANGTRLARITISGTLRSGAGLELRLSADDSATLSGDRSEGASVQTAELTRDGKTSRSQLSRQQESLRPAYGLLQANTRSKLIRDGRTTESAQTSTSRLLGRDEREVWLRASLKDGGAETRFSLHAFQRGGAARVEQFIDQLEIATPRGVFRLAEPASVTSDASGRLSGALVMVDERGNRIETLQGGLPQAGKGAGLAKAASLSDVASPEGGLCDFLTSNEGSVFMGIMASLALAFAFGTAGGIIFAELLLGNILTTIVGALAAANIETARTAEERQFWEGLSLLTQLMLGFGPGGVEGMLANLLSYVAGKVAGAACNADPYFIAPDTRPETAAVRPTLTRVTGGLLDARFVPTGTVFAGVRLDGAAGADDYVDRPNRFVNGAIPAGGLAIGGWAWDAQRSLDGAPSHTSAQTTGVQKHYFIRAAAPLSVTAGDFIIQYVYLDPANPPEQLYLQLYVGDGDGEHRATWGESLAQTGGQPGSASLFPMGALPETGAWARLRVPAGAVAVTDQPVHGVLFGTVGGRAWWGPTTTSDGSIDRGEDGAGVDAPPALPATVVGAQLAYRLPASATVSIDIAGASGPVRRLVAGRATAAGYRVDVWDGKDDAGRGVSNAAYTATLRVDGAVVAARSIGITPLVATLSQPTPWSVVRGTNVPITGEVYGDQLDRYVVEAGQGETPTVWTELSRGSGAVLAGNRRGALVAAGNLADWNTGLDEFAPWAQSGLSGVYTLRLRAIARNGREAVDTFPVAIGRLAHSMAGGRIESPDGRARIDAPALAVDGSFALVALLPAAAPPALPAGVTALSGVYEVLPAETAFRRAVSLTLRATAPSPGSGIALLISDGAPGNWRSAGGAYTEGALRASIGGFAGTRAFVVAVEGADLGRIPRTAATAPPPRAASNADAPRVESASHPVAFFDDFEAGAGEWEALDTLGTSLSLASGAEAGLPAGNTALRVTRGDAGVRLARARSSGWDAARFPIIAFDYRITGEDNIPNLLLRSGGVWWQFALQAGGGANTGTRYAQNAPAPQLTADGKWRHAQVDVLAVLRAERPEATEYRVDEVVFGRLNQTAYMQVRAVDPGAPRSAWFIDNVAALAPSNRPDIAFALADGTSAWTAVIDGASTTTPPAAPLGRNSLSVAGLADGPAWLHVRARKPDGAWSATTHYPVLIDRTPPALSRPNPPQDSAMAPFGLSAAVKEASGIQLSTLAVSVGSNRYAAQPAISHDLLFGQIDVDTQRLGPAPVTIAHGARLTVSMSGLTDYAGNAQTAPLVWSFTVNAPRAQGGRLISLTVSGGESPALSPDGERMAFVAARGKTPKVWVMDTDDAGERGRTARPLTNHAAREWDPAWSPDGARITFASEEAGAQQLWIVDANGGAPRSIPGTQGRDVRSPTFSPDGRSLAFVRDGNLWRADIDGANARALTTQSDRPYQSARWQPGGSAIAAGFNLYERRVELIDAETGAETRLTQGGREQDPAWLNADALVYVAPAAPGSSLNALWQVTREGSEARILEGSGLVNSDDTEPAVSQGGGALAFVSTRGGTRNIWLRQTLQLTSFDVQPGGGAPAGEAQTLRYTLPADAVVTVEILDPSGALARRVEQAARQPAGERVVVWDGLDGAGKPLKPGAYIARLQAVFDTLSLDRFATARVLDGREIGQTRLIFEAWPGRSAEDIGLRAALYGDGDRARGLPPQIADLTVPQALLSLPAGEYQVLLRGKGWERALPARVTAGTLTTQTINLGLGSLTITALSAPGQPVGDGVAFIAVRRAGQAEQPVAFAYGAEEEFALAPGRYDAIVEYQGVQRIVEAIEVTSGRAVRREVNLGSGAYTLDVLQDRTGLLAESGRMTVRANRAGTQEKVGQALYQNPAKMRLPAGEYDVVLEYAPSDHGPYIVARFDRVRVEAGQTVGQIHNLGLGTALLQFSEASGKRADPLGLTFDVLPAGATDPQTRVAGDLYAAESQARLRPGAYTARVLYFGNEPVYSAPFEAREGATTTVQINLRMGRIEVEVVDGAGVRLAPTSVTMSLYDTARDERPMLGSIYDNPATFIAPAGKTYRLVVNGPNNTRAEVRGIQASEGQTKRVQVGSAELR